MLTIITDIILSITPHDFILSLQKQINRKYNGRYSGHHEKRIN